MEIENHRRRLVVTATVFCLLSCASDAVWYEGLRATSHKNKELHARHGKRSSTESTSIAGSSATILQNSTKMMTVSEPSSDLRRSMEGLVPAPTRLASAPSPYWRVPGDDDYAPAPAPARHRRRRSKSLKWGVGFALGAISGAFVAVLSALVLRFILSYRRRAGLLSPKHPVIFNKNITEGMLEFLTKPTDVDLALPAESQVGEGGFGKVYKVVLSNALVVAVKHVPRVNPRAANQLETPDAVPAPRTNADIRRELDSLGFIRHRNLVQLWAYIYRRDSHLLIYEFMERGSLRDAFRLMKAGQLTLSWPQRHRIMCGVAHGLAYLHNSNGGCIVHRDLKPGNILITDDLEAKLADFGLAAILPDKATHGTTEQLAGTIGYIAPEYHQTLRYSQKADIYSFGVVLAQMVTTREPTEDAFIEDGGSIGLWLHRNVNSDGGVDIIDPALRQQAGTDDDDDVEFVDEIVLAMKVAVFCTSLDPQLRPSSTDLLSMLLQIRSAAPATAALGSGRHSGRIRSGAVASEPFSDRLNEPGPW